MDEDVTRVPPASPLTKSRGGNNRSQSPRSSTSSGKVVPHYLLASTGSCHEFCKHGKQAERVGANDSRPWRKPVTGNRREDAVCKKTVVVKSKPSADHKILSPPSNETMRPEMATAAENIDVHTEQASSHSRTTVTGDPNTSDGPETTLLSVERMKQETEMASENVAVAAEGALLDVEDFKVSKMSSASSQGKSSLRTPSHIFPGSSVGRTSLDGRKAVEGRKSIDGRKGRNTKDERKGFDERKNIVPDATQKCEGKADSAENNSDGSMSADKMKSTVGSKSSPEKKGSRESKSLKIKINKKDDSLGNVKINRKSELLKKQVAVPKPEILKINPPPSLNLIAAAKPPSPLHPLSGTRSTTSDNNQVATKLSSSKLEMKKVDTPPVVSPSSGPSVNAEEITNMKKVRVLKVVSSIRRQRKLTNVAAKDPDDQGVKEDTVDAMKITHAKKSTVNASEEASRDSLFRLAPSVSKSTVRSRISYVPSRPKNSPAESGQRIATKDASTSGLRKSKAVDLQSENHRSSTLKAGRGTLIGETAHTNRRSLKKRISAGGNAIEKSSRYLVRRPSARQQKNVHLFNKVIEETASRLVRTSKNKVLALVGAFETVISIQRKSSAGTKPKSKKISSSSKAAL